MSTRLPPHWQPHRFEGLGLRAVGVEVGHLLAPKSADIDKPIRDLGTARASSGDLPGDDYDRVPGVDVRLGS